jgi:general secretion pathway protein D
MGLFDSSQINALLQSKHEIVIVPRLTALNGSSPQLHIGSQHPFVVGHTVVEGEDGMPTDTLQPEIELVEVGIKIELEGRVVENDTSKLWVRLKFTDTEILGVKESTINKGGQKYPIQQPSVSSRLTAFEQKFGFTFAMVGEPEMVETVVERGVPILGKIPYVNRLFKNVAIHSELRTQLVLVTCRLEGGKEELAAAVSQSTETSPEKSGSLTDERTSTRRPSK